MLLLIDENVPESVAQFFKSRGHDVKYVRDLFPRGTPDPVIAAIGDKLAAVLVTWDHDFDRIAERVPKGHRARFRALSRISFRCKENRGRMLIEQHIEFIEFAYVREKRKADPRLLVQIQENGIKFV
jgi:hypothetical protein